MKKYFIKNGSGEVATISAQALYLKSVHQDLLRGKDCYSISIKVILDAAQAISELYPLDKDKQPRTEESIPFIIQVELTDIS
jgi:hypothetical protein